MTPSDQGYSFEYQDAYSTLAARGTRYVYLRIPKRSGGSAVIVPKRENRKGAGWVVLHWRWDASKYPGSSNCLVERRAGTAESEHEAIKAAEAALLDLCGIQEGGAA